MDVKELREQINKHAATLQEILEVAKTEKRELKPEESTRFDAIDAERDKLMATERRLLKVAEIAETTGRRSEPTSPIKQPIDTNRASGEQQRIADGYEGLRSWFQAGTDLKLKPEQRAAAQRAGVNLDAKTLSFQLPSRAPKSLRDDDMRTWAERAQSVYADGSPGGSGEEGGYTVAHEAIRELEIALLEFGGMRKVANVIRTAKGGDMPFPSTNDTSNTGAILAENGQYTELPIHFTTMTLKAYKYSSRLILVSVELMQDSSIDFASMVGRLLGERIGRITNTHFTTGDGSDKPNGIVTAATLGVTGSLGASITYNELVDLEHSVDPAYRQGARFMFHDDTLKVLKKVRVPQYSGDTTGMPLWQSGLAVGAPDTILGYGYTINQDMAQMGPGSPSGGDKSVIFGQLSKYIIRDVRDITLVRLDERYADYGQVGFLAFSRHDGDLLDAGTHPVKYFINA